MICCSSKAFDDDRRAGNRNHRAGVEAGQSRPAERLPSQVAQPDHHAALHDRHKAGRRADAKQLLQAELDAQREHQQDDAQFGQGLHDLRVGGQGNGDVGTNHQSGQQVAQHDRLLESLKEDGGHRGRAEHQRQGLPGTGERRASNASTAAVRTVFAPLARQARQQESSRRRRQLISTDPARRPGFAGGMIVWFIHSEKLQGGADRQRDLLVGCEIEKTIRMGENRRLDLQANVPRLERFRRLDFPHGIPETAAYPKVRFPTAGWTR